MTVSREQAASILRAIANNEAPLHVLPPPLQHVADSIAAFSSDGWIIMAYRDAGDFDYIALMASPTGEVGDLDTWAHENPGLICFGPEQALTTEELERLLQRLDEGSAGR
jgi:hypothetical protein